MVCPYQGRPGHEQEVRSEPPDPDRWETQNFTPTPVPGGTPVPPVQPEVAESNALNILVQEKLRRAMEEENLPPVPPEDMGAKVPGPGGVPIKIPVVEEAEKLINPDPVTVPVAANPVQTPIILEMQTLLEGAFQAGAVTQPTGVGLSSGQLASALAQVATTDVNVVNNLQLNEQMGLMEQVMVEQFASGQIVQSLPVAEARTEFQQQAAGVPQAGVSPTQQSIVDSEASKIIQPPTASILPYQGFIVQAIMELAFGMAFKATTPTAATVIKQAETVVQKTPVVQTVKEFGLFIGSLLP